MQLIFIPRGGFADIIGQIVLACEYGRMHNRTVIIDSRYKWSMKTEFSDYFTSNNPNILFNSSVNINTPPYIINLTEQSVIEFEKLNSPDYLNETIIVYGRYRGLLLTSVLKDFKLNESLQLKLKQRLAQFSAPYVAVHVRHTDITTDYSVILDRLKKSNIKEIFLATDNVNVLNDFKKLPIKILSFSTKLSENGEQIHARDVVPLHRNEEAILDLLTLAHSEYIIREKVQENSHGVTYSGFSTLAEFLNKNKHELSDFIGGIN